MSRRINLSAAIPPVYRPLHAQIRRASLGRPGPNEFWLHGGRGSGKSTFAALEIVLGLLRDAQSNAIIYRKVAATLRESVYAQMCWAIDRLGLTDRFQYRLSPLEIRLRATGQRILFRGADDPAKSKSIKLRRGTFGYLWFEELAEFSGPDDLRTIRASIVRGTDRCVVLCTYNPPVSAASWVNRRPLPGSVMEHESSYLDLPPEFLGETFLSMAEAERLENPRAYRHMYLGEVTGTGLNAFGNLEIRPLPTEEVQSIEGALPPLRGLDWGWFPDPAHYVRCAFDAGRRTLYVLDEYRALRTPNADLFDALVREHGLTAADEVIADSAEAKSICDMRAHGLLCTGATKGPGSVRASMRWLQGLEKIVIDPARCPFAAAEFSQMEYLTDASGHPVEQYPDKNNHAIDAVRYATNRIWMRAGG